MYILSDESPNNFFLSTANGTKQCKAQQLPRNGVPREEITTLIRLENVTKRKNIASVEYFQGRGHGIYECKNCECHAHGDVCDSIQMYGVLFRPAVALLLHLQFLLATQRAYILRCYLKL